LKILIVGGGGREHALAWRLAKSSSVKEIFASPGNPGIAQLATCIPAPANISEYADMAEAHGVQLTVVGPEAPLVAGIADVFQARGLKIIGPTQAAARLEGSKIFAKQFFRRAGIPTAESVHATTIEEARSALTRFSMPLVVKADGLAAGKGVRIVYTAAEAESAILDLGPNLVLEEFLHGEEVSFIALTDGTRLVPFTPAQDHKAAYDGDQGPNTGGMGAYCDPRILTPEQSSQIIEKIMLPAIHGMRAQGTPFSGFLYAGLMMTAEGPKVLEFNVRLGDPETQALMHSFQGDLPELLNTMSSSASSAPSVCVVLASEGYPGQPRLGDLITGIAEAESAGAVVFHAGTQQGVGGQLLTSGGRVLGVTAGGDTLQDAIAAAYRAVGQIHFPGTQHRTDIGHKGLRRW